jgi:hypothetical protein
VDVGQRVQTIEAIQGQSDLARFRFRARNTWLGGGRSRTQIQEFEAGGQKDTTRSEAFVLDGDEPLDILRNPVRVAVNRA